MLIEKAVDILRLFAGRYSTLVTHFYTIKNKPGQFQ